MLRFHDPVNPMGSCLVQSVYLTTLLLGRLSRPVVNQYCAHSFARNWQMPFLNKRKGENDCRKYFMINPHQRMLPTQQGSNAWPPDHQSDAHLSEPPRLAEVALCIWFIHLINNRSQNSIQNLLIYYLSPTKIQSSIIHMEILLINPTILHSFIPL